MPRLVKEDSAEGREGGHVQVAGTLMPGSGIWVQIRTAKGKWRQVLLDPEGARRIYGILGSYIDRIAEWEREKEEKKRPKPDPEREAAERERRWAEVCAEHARWVHDDWGEDCPPATAVGILVEDIFGGEADFVALTEDQTVIRTVYVAEGARVDEATAEILARAFATTPAFWLDLQREAEASAKEGSAEGPKPKAEGRP